MRKAFLIKEFKENKEIKELFFNLFIFFNLLDALLAYPAFVSRKQKRSLIERPLFVI